MSKHTPGPWTYEREKNRVLNATGAKICTPDLGTIGSGVWISVDDRSANGHLISAAPTLLQALEQAGITLEGFKGIDADRDRVIDMVMNHFVKPALEKALGESIETDNKQVADR